MIIFEIKFYFNINFIKKNNATESNTTAIVRNDINTSQLTSMWQQNAKT